MSIVTVCVCVLANWLLRAGFDSFMKCGFEILIGNSTSVFELEDYCGVMKFIAFAIGSSSAVLLLITKLAIS